MPPSLPRFIDLTLEHTNFVVSALTASAILYTRSAAIAYFSIGAVVCSRTVKLLKRCFRQPRPLHTTPGRQKKSYGMPSTHSAVIAYYAATLTRVIPPLIIVPWSAVIAMSRIWLGHHTWPQVSVGCLYGIIFTPFWFMLWTSYGWNEYGQATEKYFVW
ncbi:hypothetical protein ABKN59_000696 [Abortiporus biennis]